MSTKSQLQAQTAYDRILARAAAADSYRKEYRSFAREFPTLVHQCGLAQAVAFAQAKKDHHQHFLEDLATVLGITGGGPAGIEEFARRARSLPVSGYVRLSRDAITAAVWLKRYVEALFPTEKENRP